MHFYPDNWNQNLEFDRLLEAMSTHCLSAIGKKRIEDLQPLEDVHELRKAYDALKEMMYIQREELGIPLQNFLSLHSETKQLEPEGAVLREEDIGKIRRAAKTVEKLLRFFKKRKDDCPRLFELSADIPFDKEIIKSIDNILDDREQVMSNASDNLMKIRTSLNKQRKILEQKFRSIQKQYKSKGVLTDSGESVRSNRKVLSVKAEVKRSIPGIIHDTSDSGKTVFIEPEEIVFINNEIHELLSEERREIYKILKELCAILRFYRPDFMAWEEYLGTLDLLHAKTRFAIKLNACCPEVNSEPGLNVVNARHPLLYLQNQAQEKPTIPFSLSLKKDKHILVISGPNAGGKSVCLKTIGLLVCMSRFAIPLPVDQGSGIGIFDSLFIDIGDSQSIEDELSTYSSKLVHMRNFLKLADQKSMVLIDEFGSGTDPNLGGAVAEACLDKLRDQGAFCIVTTHYKNLKTYADEHPTVLNGSMEFNREKLEPLFKLLVGQPGSSFTFSIAEKAQLPKNFINKAKSLVNKEDLRMEEMLAEMQKQKEKLESEYLELKEKSKKAQDRAKKYENALKVSQDQEKKRQQHKKEIELELLEKNEKRFQRLVERWKKANEKEKELEEKKVKQGLKKEKITVQKERKKLAKQLDFRRKKGKVEVGSWVSMAESKQSGKVTQIKRNKATVEMGNLSISVDVKDLFLVEKIQPKKRQPKGPNLIVKASQFSASLDIRGLRRDEAEKQLEQYIDEAIVISSDTVKILHGKGGGHLRKLVLSFSKKHKGIKEVTHEEEMAGGDGVSIIHFA